MSDLSPNQPRSIATALGNTSSLKLPPHSIDAEQAVLGGLMLDNKVWDDVADVLIESDFYRKEHSIIFLAMEKQNDASKPIDLVTLAEALDHVNQLELCGGLDYLAEIANNTPSTANILAYSSIIRERAILRQLILVANQIADSGYNPDGRESAELLDLAEQQVFKIADDRPKDGGPQFIDPLLKKGLDRLEKLFNSKGNLTGLTTGFKDLNNQTSGMQNSDLIIVAGRPSMGKTAFAINLVENYILSQEDPLPVLIFSLEMPAENLITRMLSSIGKVDQTRMRNGKLLEDDWPKLTYAINKLTGKPLYIDDTVGLNPTEMRARVRRVAKDHQNTIGMVMVDYLQLMQLRSSSENRTGEISEISRSLKLMAREFECPVVALSQLNRSLEQRPNKRPVMSDLRESGAIEQDADVIMFIYRDEVYNEDTEHKGMAEIILAKQRNGPIGTSNLSFIGKYTRFENYIPISAKQNFGGYGSDPGDLDE
ncbi:MAG: replicative DNA helicase [Pseudohongiellaceae bacterium]